MDEQLATVPETQTLDFPAVDLVTLTPIVQSALGSESAEVTSWDCEKLHAGLGVGCAIFRFAGQGRDHGQTMPWSLILKALYPGSDNTDVSASSYYKREADAYRSGWLVDLPGSLAAPRCFGVIERADGSCWIWMEDVTDEIGGHWPLAHYGVVARHVGQFNGAYLVDRSMPSWPWLSSGWLRGLIAQNAPAIPLIRDSLDHPLVRRSWPGDASSRLFGLWEERGRFLDALERLPQTLCHLDLFRRNLFARKMGNGDYQTLAVDWAFAGQAAIGEEIVPLVLGSVALMEVDIALAQALEDVVFEGYLEGLRDAGWRGDPQQVRLGYTAASLRYMFADLWRAVPIMLDESQHGLYLQAFGRSAEEICDHFVQVDRICEKLTDEARELMEVLD